jgi:hypothetical protein
MGAACREADERRTCYVYDTRYMYVKNDDACEIQRQELKQFEERLLHTDQAVVCKDLNTESFRSADVCFSTGQCLKSGYESSARIVRSLVAALELRTAISPIFHRLVGFIFRVSS